MTKPWGLSYSLDSQTPQNIPWLWNSSSIENISYKKWPQPQTCITRHFSGEKRQHNCHSPQPQLQSVYYMLSSVAQGCAVLFTAAAFCCTNNSIFDSHISRLASVSRSTLYSVARWKSKADMSTWPTCFLILPDSRIILNICASFRGDMFSPFKWMNSKKAGKVVLDVIFRKSARKNAF